LILLLSTVFISNATFADQATDILKKTLDQTSAPLVNYKSACTSCLDKQNRYETKISSQFIQEPFSVSVITKAEITKLFNEIKNYPTIPFGFPLDGCYARAHTMVQLLEQKGIVATKAWIEGELYLETKSFGKIRWIYHVAPMVMVMENGKEVPYVIDPSMFDKPVPYSEWKAAMTKDKNAKVESEYFTPRFNYSPDEKEISRTAYDLDTLDDARETNSYYKKTLADYKKQNNIK
jgi:hypothetical protein